LSYDIVTLSQFCRELFLFTTKQLITGSASTFLFWNSRDCVPKIPEMTLTIAISD